MSSAQKPDVSVLGELPEHLTQATEDAAKAIQKRIEAKKEDAEAEKEAGDPKAQEEYTFQFKWTDECGKLWKGTFTNRVLTHVDRQAVGALQSRWQLGSPHNSFDPEVSAMNYMLAHMTITLKRDEEWAKDLRMLHSTDLLQELYKEVDSHESTFHGYSSNKEASEKGS